jgi:hypothetical protein
MVTLPHLPLTGNPSVNGFCTGEFRTMKVSRINALGAPIRSAYEL